MTTGVLTDWYPKAVEIGGPEFERHYALLEPFIREWFSASIPERYYPRSDTFRISWIYVASQPATPEHLKKMAAAHKAMLALNIPRMAVKNAPEHILTLSIYVKTCKHCQHAFVHHVPPTNKCLFDVTCWESND